MSNRHWIKLWLSWLDLPRMGNLPDEQWRLAVELELVAGENGEDGILPSIPDLSWRLRRDPKQLEALLKSLEKTKTVVKQNRQWVVVDFAIRQSAVPATARKQAQRKADGTAGIGNRDRYLK